MLKLLSHLTLILASIGAVRLSAGYILSCVTTWNCSSPSDLSTMISKYVFALT